MDGEINTMDIFDLIREQLVIEQLQELKIPRFLSKLKGKLGKKSRKARSDATHEKIVKRRYADKQKTKKEVQKRLAANKLKRKLRRGEPIDITPKPKQIEYKPR